MGFLDIVLGILLLLGLYKGWKNGLFIELAALVALIGGIYCAIHFSYITADYLSEHVNWETKYIKIASFLLTFCIAMVLVHYAGKLLTKVADFAMLGILNKVAGAIFGTLKVAVILGAFLLFFEKATSSFDFIKEDTKTNSVLYAPVRDIGAFVFSLVFEERKENEV